MAEQTLNIPQIIAVVLVGFLAIRWFLSSSGTPSSGQNAGRQINQAHVDQILSMFPQLERRTVMWDLQRNGGSVPATTERVLSGRELESPPPSFQPPMPPSTQRAGITSTTAQQVKAALPDLITRYNLSSRIAGTSEGTATEADPSRPEDARQKQAWSQSKAERSDILRRRREDMILAARRKMEERDNAAAVKS